MKKRPPLVQPLWDPLFPLLISRWRKLMKLPVGPEDRLQTREFQSMTQALQEYRVSYDLSPKENFGAYLLYDFPIHYAQGISLLRELPQRPSRVLELGSLSAPFSLAAAQYGATEIFALDTDERALRYGADISGHLGYPLSIRTCDITRFPLPVEGKWDLIILPYSLFRCFAQKENQLRYIESLLPALSPQGHLLIVESSATPINRKFLSLRDSIAQAHIPISAPCLWKGDCPALRHNSSPCFAQREFEKPFLIKEIQRACDINQSSLKMSYLLLRSPESSPPILPENLYRVVSPPVNTYKGERFFLCGIPGKKTLGTTLKIHPKQSKAYEYLRRGDVISIQDAPELDNDLQVIEKTRLELYAPCDKPMQS